jgi:hypothetical protein
VRLQTVADHRQEVRLSRQAHGGQPQDDSAARRVHRPCALTRPSVRMRAAAPEDLQLPLLISSVCTGHEAALQLLAQRSPPHQQPKAWLCLPEGRRDAGAYGPSRPLYEHVSM